jgi:UDP-2-acetamido-2-deoxy-ribo-hexuluronate aminotransferase
MEAIMKIATAHKLFVIEDNAQGIGNDYSFSDGTTKKPAASGISAVLLFIHQKFGRLWRWWCHVH